MKLRILKFQLVTAITFMVLVQGDIHNLIDEAYKKKYSNSPYFAPMISHRAKAATGKIIPV